MVKIFSKLKFLILIWVALFITFVAHIPQQTSNSETTDAIVVFTGSKGRIREATKLYEQKLAPLLHVSGVGCNVVSDVDELTHKAKFDAKCGRVDMDSAKNTKQNAIKTAEWIQNKNIKSIRLVTASYHMPRSILEMSELLPDVHIIPHPIHEPILKNKKSFIIHIGEFHKLFGALCVYIVKKGLFYILDHPNAKPHITSDKAFKES